jgi:hypothetical protein
MRRNFTIPRGTVREAIEFGEAFADGQADLETIEQFNREQAAQPDGHRWITTTIPALVAALSWASRVQTGRERSFCNTVRCIFGPLPFRPVGLVPRWLTPTVKQLADSIYQERAFDRLPVLADALEEVGCDQPDILSHLRGGGEHCRGCWAVDLVVGKE